MNNTDYPELPEFLDRTVIVGSYTMMNTYANICPYQCYRRYVKKDIPYKATSAMEWGKTVHSAMEYRVGGKPLPDNMRHWEPLVAPLAGRAVGEQKLGITMQGQTTGFFDKNVWIRTVVDTSLISGTTAYLQDWKTGNAREEPFELETQAVLLHAKNPGLTKIVGRYAWLKENRLGEMHNLSDTTQAWNKVCTIMSEINQSRQMGKWEKRRGPLCGYCDVRDCEFNRKPADK